MRVASQPSAKQTVFVCVLTRVSDVRLRSALEFQLMRLGAVAEVDPRAVLIYAHHPEPLVRARPYNNAARACVCAPVCRTNLDRMLYQLPKCPRPMQTIATMTHRRLVR